MAGEAGPLTLTTPDGLRFEAHHAGDRDAPVVLCLHGFPDHPSTFRHQFGPLAEAGFRVVAPVMRGYEPSSQPADGDYSLLALAGDVLGWIDDLGVEQAHLIGHDWGAAVTEVVAARHPDRVHSLTSLAIPPLPRIPDAVRHVPRQLLRSWYMTFFQVPVVSDRALAAGDWQLLRRLWRVWSPGHAMTDTEWSELRTRFEAPGVVAAALAYYRQNATPPLLLGLRSTPAMEVIELRVPRLIVHGTEDGCMDRRLFDHAVRDADHRAGVTRVEIDGAGHFLHLEAPDQVNELLVGHLA